MKVNKGTVVDSQRYPISRICFFIFLSVCFLPVESHAAAWLQPKGDGLVIGNVQSYSSCHFWGKQGNLQSGPCFRQFSINPYAEYGVTPNFTLIINPTFLSYSQSGQLSPFALGFAVVGGRFLINKKDYDTFSFQLEYNQPFKSKNFGNSGSPATPSAQYSLANEQSYADIRLLYGMGGTLGVKKSSSWYVDAESAYRPYFEGAADEIHVDFMLGLKTIEERLVFEIQELNTISLHNPKNSTDPNYNIFTVMPNVIYWYRSGMALQCGIKQDFAGTNVGRGTAPFVAFWFKF